MATLITQRHIQTRKSSFKAALKKWMLGRQEAKETKTLGRLQALESKPKVMLCAKGQPSLTPLRQTQAGTPGHYGFEDSMHSMTCQDYLKFGKAIC